MGLRLSTAASQATSGADCWGQTFGIDAVANLGSVSVSQCTGYTLSVTVNANNQITGTGFSYDAAGNMTQDGSGNTYTFDAENRIVTASGMSGGPYSYTFDGNNMRVEKANASSGTFSWRNIAGSSIAESDLTGSTTNGAYFEYVFFAGRRLARRDSSGNVLFYFTDHLGNSHTITNATGTVCYDADFTPYGTEMAHTNTCPQNYKFTGYERDPETGLDYAFARYYSSSLGRFLGADPFPSLTGHPQTENRYAYVSNDPSNFVDPAGLSGGPRYTCGDDGWGCPVSPRGGIGSYGNAIWGNDIFDAITGQPGTYLSRDMYGNLSWGFSIPAWYSAIATLEQQHIAASRGAYYAQLGATVGALQAAGVSSDKIQAFINANNSFDSNTVQIEGGNFDFLNPVDQFGNPIIDLSCPMERCDEGRLGTLDFSHNDGTFHLDTADPYNFPGGTLEHFFVDLFLGNFFYVAIPRPWP